MEDIGKKVIGESKKEGLKDGELVTIEYNPLVHKDVCEFIKELQRASEITKNSTSDPFKEYALTNFY